MEKKEEEEEDNTDVLSQRKTRPILRNVCILKDAACFLLRPEVVFFTISWALPVHWHCCLLFGEGGGKEDVQSCGLSSVPFFYKSLPSWVFGEPGTDREYGQF